MSLPAANSSRTSQIRQTWKMARQHDRALPLWVFGTAVVAGALMFAIFWLITGTDDYFSWFFTILATVLTAALAGLLVFGRRAQRAAYSQIEGQKGAAASALSMLRRGWSTEPMVAFNKQQDVVHRVIGPVGVVLVGEGNPNRLKPLLESERKKTVRVLAEIPVHEVICGNGEGEVSLAKLVKHVTKLPKHGSAADVTDIQHRLKALDATRGNIPMPKGPMPTSTKGMRKNMRGR